MLIYIEKRVYTKQVFLSLILLTCIKAAHNGCTTDNLNSNSKTAVCYIVHEAYYEKEYHRFKLINACLSHQGYNPTTESNNLVHKV